MAQGSDINQVTKILGTLDMNLEPANKSLSTFAERITKLNQELQVLDKTAKQAAQSIREAFQAALQDQKTVAESIKAMSQATVRTEQETARAVEAITGKKIEEIKKRELQKALAIIESERRVTAAIEAEAKKQEEARKKAEGKASNQGPQFQEGLKYRLSWFLTGSLFFGAIRAYTLLANTVSDVEKGMIALEKVMGDQITDMPRLRNSILESAYAYGVLANQAFEVAELWGRQGRSQEEVEKLVPAALLLANVAEIENMDEAVALLTATIQQYALSVEDAVAIVDKWNEVSNNFPANARDMADAISRTGAVAREVGIDIDLLHGHTVALREAMGQTGKEIGTALRMIYSRLRRESTAGVLWEEAGIRIKEDADTFRDMSDVLAELADKWETFTEVQREEIAVAAAGDRRKTYFLNLMANYDTAINAAITSQYSLGSAQRENEKMMESLSKKVVQLKVALQELAVAAGDAGLLYIMKTLIESGRDFFKLIEALPAPVRSLIIVTAELTSVMAILNLSMKTFANKTLAEFITSITATTAAAKAVAGALAAINLTIAGLAGIAGATFAIIGLINALDGLNEATTDLKTSMGETIKERVKEQKQLEGMVSRYQELRNKLGTLEKGSKAYVTAQTEIKAITETLIDILPQAAEGFTETGEAILGTGEKAKQAVAELNKYNIQLVKAEQLRAKFELPRLKREREQLVAQLNAKLQQAGGANLEAELAKVRAKARAEAELQLSRASWGFNFDPEARERVVTQYVEEQVSAYLNSLGKKSEEIKRLEEQISKLNEQIDYFNEVASIKIVGDKIILPSESGEETPTPKGVGKKWAEEFEPVQTALEGQIALIEKVNKQTKDYERTQEELANQLDTLETKMEAYGQTEEDIAAYLQTMDQVQANRIAQIGLEKKGLEQLNAERAKAIQEEQKAAQAFKAANAAYERMRQTEQDKEYLREELEDQRALVNKLKGAWEEKVEVVKAYDNAIEAVTNQLQALNYEAEKFPFDRILAENRLRGITPNAEKPAEAVELIDITEEELEGWKESIPLIRKATEARESLAQAYEHISNEKERQISLVTDEIEKLKVEESYLTKQIELANQQVDLLKQQRDEAEKAKTEEQERLKWLVNEYNTIAALFNSQKHLMTEEARAPILTQLDELEKQIEETKDRIRGLQAFIEDTNEEVLEISERSLDLLSEQAVARLNQRLGETKREAEKASATIEGILAGISAKETQIEAEARGKQIGLEQNEQLEVQLQAAKQKGQEYASGLATLTKQADEAAQKLGEIPNKYREVIETLRTGGTLNEAQMGLLAEFQSIASPEQSAWLEVIQKANEAMQQLQQQATDAGLAMLELSQQLKEIGYEEQLDELTQASEEVERANLEVIHGIEARVQAATDAVTDYTQSLEDIPEDVGEIEKLNIQLEQQEGLLGKLTDKQEQLKAAAQGAYDMLMRELPYFSGVWSTLARGGLLTPEQMAQIESIKLIPDIRASIVQAIDALLNFNKGIRDTSREIAKVQEKIVELKSLQALAPLREEFDTFTRATTAYVEELREVERAQADLQLLESLLGDTEETRAKRLHVLGLELDAYRARQKALSDLLNAILQDMLGRDVFKPYEEVLVALSKGEVLTKEQIAELEKLKTTVQTLYPELEFLLNNFLTLNEWLVSIKGNLDETAREALQAKFEFLGLSEALQAMIEARQALEGGKLARAIEDMRLAIERGLNFGGIFSPDWLSQWEEEWQTAFGRLKTDIQSLAQLRAAADQWSGSWSEFVAFATDELGIPPEALYQFSNFADVIGYADEKLQEFTATAKALAQERYLIDLAKQASELGQSFEQGIESGFRNAVKGLLEGQTEVSEILKGFAQDILGTLGDYLSQILTKKIFGNPNDPNSLAGMLTRWATGQAGDFLGIDTASLQMREAFVIGGETAAQLIQNALIRGGAIVAQQINTGQAVNTGLNLAGGTAGVLAGAQAGEAAASGGGFLAGLKNLITNPTFWILTIGTALLGSLLGSKKPKASIKYEDRYYHNVFTSDFNPFAGPERLYYAGAGYEALQRTRYEQMFNINITVNADNKQTGQTIAREIANRLRREISMGQW